MYRDLGEYLDELRSALRDCRIEYYKIYEVSPETIETLETEIRRRCGGSPYFQIYGEGILITPRVALASLIRLKRASKRGRSIARKAYIEFLLRTLGIRKISRSIEASGAMGEGEKTVVVAICGDCDLGDLGGIARRACPGERDMLEGMKKLASLCLGGASLEELDVEGGIENLEKILLGCGARIEIEG